MAGTRSRWREVCSACGRTWALGDRRWKCSCGGLLDLLGPLAPPPPPDRTAPRATLARYGPALPPGAGRVDLGMTTTPLDEVAPGRFVKVELGQPTGSFKDRGAAVMIGAAVEVGATSLVVDSSGNAGLAAAAHAAAAGLDCTVFVPAGTPPAKMAAMADRGAEVVEVAGDRTAAAVAAQEEVAASGAFYASHVHQPAFHHGVKTLAFEVFEQLGAPGTVVVPAGNGTLVLGLWLGFGELVASGLMAARPAIVAVQAEACAPLVGARHDGTAPPGATAAAGIAVPAPPRAAQVRACVLASGGRLVSVTEDAIAAARRDLAERGYPVSATGAVGWAAAGSPGAEGGPVVVVLSG